MSNQEKTPQDKPVKPAPQTAEPQTAEPARAEPKSQPKSARKPQRRRGFFSQLFSHLMVAAIAVIAVSAYMHWTDILKYTGTRVCAYDMLGQYASQPAKVPPVDLKKPAPPAPKQSTKQQTPAAQKPQANTSPAIKSTPAAQNLKQARNAARKLFWTESATALTAYEKLVAEHPDNAGLRVELGHVYYKTGNNQQAVEAYLKAGKQFVAQKNTERTDEMIKTLEKLAPEKARELAAEKQKPSQ